MKTPPDFLIAKGLSLGSRFALIAVLAVVGIGLQLFVSFTVGWLLLFISVLLGATRGKSNAPDGLGRGEWQNVTMDELEDARKLIAESGRVREANAPFHLGTGAGCGLVFFLVVGVVLVGVVAGAAVDSGSLGLAPVAHGGSVSLLFIIDALTLLLPLWFFGRVRTWQPPNFEMRLKQIWAVYQAAYCNPNIEFRPSLQIANTKDGSVPLDVRLMIKLKDSDPNFIGIQVQTAINDVQGRKYPYTYCVLIAKPEFGLVEKAKRIVEMPPTGGFTVGFLGLFADTNDRKEAKFPRLNGAVVELKREAEMEITVVRQGTGHGGYKTSPEQSCRIFDVAYGLAYAVLQA